MLWLSFLHPMKEAWSDNEPLTGAFFPRAPANSVVRAGKAVLLPGLALLQGRISFLAVAIVCVACWTLVRLRLFMRAFLLASMAESCLSVTSLPRCLLSIKKSPRNSASGLSSTRFISTLPSSSVTIRPHIEIPRWAAANRVSRVVGTSIHASQIRQDGWQGRPKAAERGNGRTAASDVGKGGKHWEFHRQRRGSFVDDNNERFSFRSPSISSPLSPPSLSHKRQMSTGTSGRQQQKNSTYPDNPSRMLEQSSSHPSFLPPLLLSPSPMSPAALAEAASVRAEAKEGINQPSVALKHLLRVSNGNHNPNPNSNPDEGFRFATLIVRGSVRHVRGSYSYPNHNP